MKIRPEILDHWPEVSARLPAGFDVEATARLRGAFTRAREIKNAETLLRLALAYGGLGMSLRETCVWAEAGGIARLSDPSLLARLCTAAPWLGDIVLADRYYARPRDLRPVIEAGADFIVRTGWNSLRLLQANGEPFDLFAALAAQAEQESEVQVRIHEGMTGAPPPEPLILRLVIRRKEPEQAQAEQKRLLKEAKKRGKQPDPRSLEAAKYILLLTSLPAAAFPPADILALYRFRWQIELAFKRFKSLAGLDTLPAKKPELARAWIYARLIVAIIAEQIAGQVPDSSPSGPDHDIRKPIALASHEDSPGHHLRCHSWTAPVANCLQRIQPNPSSPL